MIFSFSFYFEYIYLLTATRINIRSNNINRVTFEPWCVQKKGNGGKKKRRRSTGFPLLNDDHFHENNWVAMRADDEEATKLLYAYAHRSINSKSISLTKLTTHIDSCGSAPHDNNDSTSHVSCDERGQSVGRSKTMLFLLCVPVQVLAKLAGSIGDSAKTTQVYRNLAFSRGRGKTWKRIKELFCCDPIPCIPEKKKKKP